MKTVKHIGLFFGSFNPIHNGHLMIANWIAEFGDQEQVWFIVSPQSPFKQRQSLLADYHRIELVNRAIADYPKFRASNIESKLPKPSYTIDTLAYLTEQYPGYQFTLIMGSDQLNDFHRWKNAEQLLEQYRILVYPRKEGKNLQSSPKITTLQQHPSFIRIQAPLMEISSSFIRKSIQEGRDVRFFLPPAVWEYISEMNFYK